MDVKTATTAELVAAYNVATGKNIKRFSTRADGERLTLKALNNGSPAPARRVNGTVGSKRGRPAADYSVKLMEGVTDLQAKSLRGKLAAWLETQPEKTARISVISTQFNREMRSVTQKMFVSKHLVRID